MRKFLIVLASIATLMFNGTVGAHSVWIEVTPNNIDQLPLAFTVKAKEQKEDKEFEITVKPKTGKLQPARFFEPRFSKLPDDPKFAAPAVKRVDRESESVTFAFQVPKNELNGVKFDLWKMGYAETKDERGNTKLVPMPSATIFTFSLNDFAGKLAVTRVRAVYFVSKEGGKLSDDDLKKHPEVETVHNFADLQRLAAKDKALWIDLTAIPLLQGDKERLWLINKAQEGFTFAMVGCNEPLKCFRDTLDCFGISGPGQIDWTKYDLSPGFSVIRLKREKVGKETQVSGPMQGYKVAPTVQKILNVTDALLAEKPAPATP